MKKYILFFITLFAAGLGFGQKLSEQNLYMLNPFLINPAFAGSNGGFVSMVGFRNSFVGVPDSPKSIYLSLHSPVSEKTSLGGNISGDSRGVLNTFTGNLSAAYAFNIATDHKIRFGLSGGVYRQSVQLDKLQNVDLADPTLTKGNQNFTTYNFGFGTAYQWKELSIGVALQNLEGEEKLLRAYTTMYASYTFKSNNETWKIKPTVLYQHLPNVGSLTDFQLMGIWKNLIWAQTGYRTNRSLIFSAGITIENIKIAYAYQSNVGTAGLPYNTNEVGLLFTLNKKK
jgi:type IX secretion system PorP/SprF family membrane protein